MLLDSSDEENEPDSPEPVKDINSNSDAIIDVPEYAAEIHDYLKKAEVCDNLNMCLLIILAQKRLL